VPFLVSPLAVAKNMSRRLRPMKFHITVWYIYGINDSGTARQFLSLLDINCKPLNIQRNFVHNSTLLVYHLHWVYKQNFLGNICKSFFGMMKKNVLFIFDPCISFLVEWQGLYCSAWCTNLLCQLQWLNSSSSIVPELHVLMLFTHPRLQMTFLSQ